MQLGTIFVTIHKYTLVILWAKNIIELEGLPFFSDRGKLQCILLFWIDLNHRDVLIVQGPASAEHPNVPPQLNKLIV